MFSTSHLPDQKTFLARLSSVAAYLGVSENALLGVMFIESGIKPYKQNQSSKAAGLIQFMPKTCTELGTTTEKVLAMSATQQLCLVQKYLAPYRGRMTSFLDLYLCVFYPSAVGQPDSYQIGKNATKQNSAFDLDKDGIITRGEIKAKILSMLPEGAKSLIQNYAVPVLFLVAGVVVYFITKKK